MLKYPKFKIREIIIKIIQEKKFIVSTDLMKECGMWRGAALRHLILFEIECDLIKSFNRRNYGQGRT